MLKPGGMMVYSTCTFSVEENEGTLDYILKNYPDMHVIPIEQQGEGLMPAHPEWVDGPDEISYARRLWPHHLHGEGHFTALLRKDGSGSSVNPGNIRGMKELPEEFAGFLKDSAVTIDFDPARMVVQGDHLSYLPEDMPELEDSAGCVPDGIWATLRKSALNLPAFLPGRQPLTNVITGSIWNYRTRGWSNI